MMIAGVIKLLKEVIELAKESNSSELKEKLLELQNSIFDLTAENRELKQRIAELERKEQVESQLVSDQEVYWWNRNGHKDGPYCKVCWHSDEKLIQLMSTSEKGLYNCVKCEGMFRSSEYVTKSSVAIAVVPGGSFTGRETI